MTFACRSLTEEDADAWLALLREGTRAFPLGFLMSAAEAAEMTREIARERMQSGAFRGVFDGDRLVGFCGYRRQGLPRLAHRAMIGPFFVTGALQGSGAAATLMQAVIAEACAAGVAQLDLTVDTENARAIAFYEREGFTCFGRRPDAVRIDGQSRDDLLYRLPL
jgi:RimJ/RimL family protein N-acetyltransferase